MSEITYRIILIGNTGVGKRSFLRKLSKDESREKNISTIGIEKKTFDLDLEVNNNGKTEKKKFCIILFVTTSLDKFRRVNLSYFKGCDGIFLIYDIADKSTFESVELWTNSIRDIIVKISDSRYSLILIGNKLDLVEEEIKAREIDEDEAKKMCEKYDMIWGGEQSIKNLDFEAFTKLFEKYIGEIYKIVGEKQLGKQRPKNLANFEKKENKEINYIHALNKYISF